VGQQARIFVLRVLALPSRGILKASKCHWSLLKGGEIVVLCKGGLESSGRIMLSLVFAASDDGFSTGVEHKRGMCFENSSKNVRMLFEVPDN